MHVVCENDIYWSEGLDAMCGIYLCIKVSLVAAQSTKDGNIWFSVAHSIRACFCTGRAFLRIVLHSSSPIRCRTILGPFDTITSSTLRQSITFPCVCLFSCQLASYLDRLDKYQNFLPGDPPILPLYLMCERCCNSKCIRDYPEIQGFGFCHVCLTMYVNPGSQF